MRGEAGRIFVASAIWQIGFPPLPPCATEQQLHPLSPEEIDEVPVAIQKVLDWLDHIANALLSHRETKAYAEARRRSGSARGNPGLSATERSARTAIRCAQFDFQTAKLLPRSGGIIFCHG